MKKKEVLREAIGEIIGFVGLALLVLSAFTAMVAVNG